MLFIDLAGSKILKKFTKNKGFTLAEVLVTLVVIGIVAALAIPSLLQNTQDAELKAALKKSYAIIGQALEGIKINNAGSIADLYPGAVQTRDAFANQMNYVKKCDSGLGVCWANKTIGIDGVSDVSWAWSWSGAPSLLLNNGMTLLFGFRSTACTDNDGGFVSTPVLCTIIFVDVNGLKPPNIYGRDVFRFYVTKDRILPGGSNDAWSNPALNCNVAGDSGHGCAAKYLKGQ